MKGNYKLMAFDRCKQYLHQFVQESLPGFKKVEYVIKENESFGGFDCEVSIPGTEFTGHGMGRKKIVAKTEAAKNLLWNLITQDVITNVPDEILESISLKCEGGLSSPQSPEGSPPSVAGSVVEDYTADSEDFGWDPSDDLGINEVKAEPIPVHQEQNDYGRNMMNSPVRKRRRIEMENGSYHEGSVKIESEVVQIKHILEKLDKRMEKMEQRMSNIEKMIYSM